MTTAFEYSIIRLHEAVEERNNTLKDYNKRRYPASELDDYHSIVKAIEEERDEYLKAIKLLSEHSTKEQWISVDERLPNEHEKVIVLFGDENILMGIVDSDGSWSLFYSDGINREDEDRQVTHWQPLPNLPVKK